jgi:glyoxylase-like metal-dependent hydrolase (beta-lactamase superfamily II)
VKPERVTHDVFRLGLAPLGGLNAYVVGELLVDAGLGLHAGRILKAVSDRGVVAHVLTHAHGDHAGGSKRVTETLGIPAWCGAADADALAAGKPVAAGRVQALFTWRGVSAARQLREGDEVGAGFVVLDTPGHSPGHIALWREQDRTLVCGDVFLNMNLYTARPGLGEPPRAFTVDPARNRESARKLAELEPSLVLFGHGKPLRDPAKLAAFASSLST